MKKRLLGGSLQLGLAGSAQAQAPSQTQYQSRVTLSGYLRDAATGEALIGAAFYVPRLREGTTANAYGFYSISLPQPTRRASW